MFCCQMMHQSVSDHKIISYSKRFDEYMIPISQDSGICLSFCPWCGTKLPESKRELWFEELDRLGIEFSLFDTEQVPSPYLSDEWWKNNTRDH